MRFFRIPLNTALVLVTLFVLASFASPAWAGPEQKSPAMVQWEALSKQYVQLRDVDARRLGPQPLLTAAESLEGQVQKLVDSAAGDPSVKSKALELLSNVYTFDGKAPESRQAYAQFLDVLEGWQGRDYAVMVVRRAGDRALKEERKPAKALGYYDLLLSKYPDHASKPHALYHSGLACIDAKDYKEAGKRFDQVVAADPTSYYAPWALRKKAYALAEMVPADGDFSASLAVLDQLVAQYPTPHWKAYVAYRKGYTLARQKKLLEAIAEYSKGINEQPSSPYSWMGQKHVAQIRKILEQEVLDKLAQEQRKGEPPGTASAKAVGPVSRIFPGADDRVGEEGGR